MANCLVTGGAGFIGSHLVEALLAAGNRVRILDDFSTGKRDNLRGVQDQVQVIQGSVTDGNTVRTAVAEIDRVFHLAAIASVQRSLEDPLATHEMNATGTLHVLDAARRAGVRRVVYAATCAAYGDLSGGARVETDPLAPLSPYAAAKLAGEYYCQSFTTAYGLETVRLRFFNVFGPRQDPSSPYSGVIALFQSAMRTGKAPTIYGDGLQTRDFVYVADVVQALVLAAEAPAAAGKVYNIGSGKATSVLDLVRAINVQMGADLSAKHAPARPGEVRHSLAEIGKAQRDLGYRPQVGFDEGLRLTLAAKA